MSTRQSFYRWSLAAPTVVPIAALGLGLLVGEAALLPAVFLGGSLLYTWWSYPLFAGAVAYWSRHQTAEGLERTAIWLPLLYAPLCGLQLALTYGRDDAGMWWGDFATGALFAVPFGYAYVAAIRFLARLIFDPRGSRATAAGSREAGT